MFLSGFCAFGHKKTGSAKDPAVGLARFVCEEVTD